MRFLPDGADIPDELIRSVRDGRALFLCGAGVSCRVGLPLFEPLTHRIYGNLGEAPDHEPSERRAIERGEYDRALRSLERRTHRAGEYSRVRTAVARLLKVPNASYSDHRALLELSRDPEGRPRLLTTNFDTLFERAARDMGISIPSHAGKSLPEAGRERDHGILHLHGRIADPDLSLDGTDLILTSADFGEAYLRDGWASRYVEHRMRLGTLVLIGYAAEDAALRLLLETLDADRDRFRDLKDIYSLDKQTCESASVWKAKGITPIEFPDYDAMYQTVLEWAKYNGSPTAYGRQRIAEILIGQQ